MRPANIQVGGREKISLSDTHFSSFIQDRKHYSVFGADGQ